MPKDNTSVTEQTSKTQTDEGHSHVHSDAWQRVSDELEAAHQHDIAMVPQWKEEGHKVFSQSMWNEWDWFVEDSTGPDYAYNNIPGNVLEAAKAIDPSRRKSENVRAVRKILDGQAHSGGSYLIVSGCLKDFCSNDKSFVWDAKMSRYGIKPEPYDYRQKGAIVRQIDAGTMFLGENIDPSDTPEKIERVGALLRWEQEQIFGQSENVEDSVTKEAPDIGEDFDDREDL